MLIVPHWFDQFFWARKLQVLQLATAATKRVAARRSEQKLDALLRFVPNRSNMEACQTSDGTETLAAFVDQSVEAA